MKKLLLATSMVLLFSVSAGVASAAESTVTSAATKAIEYTITLKVGESYQLGYNPTYGRNYTYYIAPDNQDYFGVSRNGMLTAYKHNFQIMPWEDHGEVNVVDASGNHIERVHVRIVQ